MISPVSKTINGREYTITPWPAMDAVERFAQCMKVLSPLISALPKLLEVAKYTEEEQQEGWADIASSLTTSCSSLDPKLFREVVETMTDGIFSVEDNCKINPKVYFNDHQEDLFPLLVASFQVQILPFMKGNSQSLNSEKKARLQSRKA